MSIYLSEICQEKEHFQYAYVRITFLMNYDNDEFIESSSFWKYI